MGAYLNNQQYDKIFGELKSLRAKNKRLRAALREIANLKPEDMPYGDTHIAAVIADEALREQTGTEPDQSRDKQPVTR